MEHACACSVICPLAVYLRSKTVCACVSVHLFSSGLYIYIQHHLSLSAVGEYRPALCFELTGVTPNCSPPPDIQDICSESGLSKQFEFSL